MWKILYKNTLALYRYRDFRVGIFFGLTLYILSRQKGLKKSWLIGYIAMYQTKDGVLPDI